MRATSGTATSKKKITYPTGLGFPLVHAIEQAYGGDPMAICLPDRQPQRLILI